MNVIMYVDDGKIYVLYRSLETNVIILQLAYKKVEEWLFNAGLAPDLRKRELMHYARRKEYNCSPPITLQDSDGVTRKIVAEKTTRWLRIHFNRKLLFNHHVKIAAAPGSVAVNTLTMLANTV
jgi:hypothetical protein